MAVPCAAGREFEPGVNYKCLSTKLKQGMHTRMGRLACSMGSRGMQPQALRRCI